VTDRRNPVEDGWPARSGSGPAPEQEPVVVRDRRRIDPLTGQVRVPDSASPGAGPVGPGGSTVGGAATPDHAAVPGPQPDPADTKLAELVAQLDERTNDLQRVSAEYANYRRRVDRDREVVVRTAKAQVAADLLTALDDVARAEQHGDLNGPFKAVADKLVNALTKAGLESFGAQGDEFDPAVHEAVQHTSAEDDAALGAGPTVAVVATVLRQGYRIGDRVLRPAMVAVIDRAAPTLDAPTEPAPDSGTEAETD
jgi:molecular chaperone GrpE